MLISNFTVFLNHDFFQDDLFLRTVKKKGEDNRKKVVLQESINPSTTRDLKRVAKYIYKNELKWHLKHKKNRKKIEEQCALFYRLILKKNKENNTQDTLFKILFSSISYTHHFWKDLNVKVVIYKENKIVTKSFNFQYDTITKIINIVNYTQIKYLFSREYLENQVIAYTQQNKNLYFNDPIHEKVKPGELLTIEWYSEAKV